VPTVSRKYPLLSPSGACRRPWSKLMRRKAEVLLLNCSSTRARPKCRIRGSEFPERLGHASLTGSIGSIHPAQTIIQALAYSGEITVQSDFGRGATFKVLLPQHTVSRTV
jgi:hypothetical protein